MVVGLSGAALSLMPYADALEERFGLELLFRLRGARTPPSELVIANIDRNSSAALAAPDQPDRWPRQSHAGLIQQSHASGAALIGFNVFFPVSQPGGDEAMAEAMRQAGSVVLTSYLKPRQLPDNIYVESIVEPIPKLADSALASAPFLLPQSPVASRYWCW